MSDFYFKIKNPKGGHVISVRNFVHFKRLFLFMNSYVKLFSFEIPDFDFNEFISKRTIEEPKFSIGRYLYETELIEKPLLSLFNIYKKNPRDYNKLIEIDQKIGDKLFFAATRYDMVHLFEKSPNFDKFKKIWERYVSFPKLTNINLNNLFINLKREPDDFEKVLYRRNVILDFLKPYFSYPIKEIPVDKTTVDKTTVDKSTQEKDNIDLKSPFLNKMKEEQVWEKLFPKTNINRHEKKRIYDDFHKNYPKDDFYKYIKGFKDINPNYDWKKYIQVFLPHILHKPGSFPNSLLLTKDNYPIPGTIFNLTAAPILNEFEISVSPVQSFLVKFRNIFKETTITFNSARQSESWLHKPNINYWPQQLIFAVWCATSGCGISLNEKYPKRIQQFINFHVYFTIRRILYEMGVVLPGDPIFKQIGNHYNLVSFQKLCQEFNLPVNPDFRYKGGRNHGLGSIFVRVNGRWLIGNATSGLINWPNQISIFHDEHGIGGQVGKIVNIKHNGKQYEWFSPYLGKGITKAGAGRLNRSVEAFVYCIVGAEVNVRSSIVDSGGGGQETQQEMLKLFEEAVVEEDIASSVQRYQLAVQEAKLQLNFAIAPSIWLIPSNLILNTESAVGYNNFLQKANDLMSFGLNQAINDITKSVGTIHGIKKSKVNLPHAAKKQKEKPAIDSSAKPMVDSSVKPMVDSSVKPTFKKSEIQNHDLNKNIAMISAAGIGWWLFHR